MIVRDAGDAWQIVLQTDHAVLSGQFAQQWGNERFARPRPFRSVVSATARHDDGWAVWERAPSLLSKNGETRPRNFLDVQVLSHLAFYRAMIASVLEDDAYAGLLVSMHGAGIYNGRYGTNPQLKLTFADFEQEQVDKFVQEQEEKHGALIQQLGVPEEERWPNYKLLQIFDFLSLYFCMKDLEGGEADRLEPVPVNYTGEETALRIDPDGPWRVRVDPYPFAEEPATFTVLRRVLPKRSWADADEFRRDFFANEPKRTTITVGAS
jgi:Protein of unknown function (DUF3891)